jgi:ribosome maturation factor RimP
MTKIGSVLHEKLEKLIGSMGYELIGCEQLPMGGRKVFRIYIDNEKGVTLDDCSRVSHQVSAMMDVEVPLQGRYTLEVSSPGVDRPLFEIKHYQKYIGCRVKLKLTAAINQRRQYKGILQRVEGENIHILVDDSEKEVVLPFSAIEKGNLVRDIHI